MADLNKLMEKIEADKNFEEELSKASSKEELLEKCKEAGFELTDKDLEEIKKSLDESELSDEELENVSGGVTRKFGILAKKRAFTKAFTKK